MKKKILLILILFCTILSLGFATQTSARADSLLIEDGYFPFDAPVFLHADENITVVGKNSVYVVLPNNSVTTYDITAKKAVYEDDKLVRLSDDNLYVVDEEIASSVVDFDVDGKKIAYVCSDAVYVCYDISSPSNVISISGSGFDSVAISENGIYLKKDMGQYANVYLLDETTRCITLYLSHLKNFKSLIFDTKLWGVDGNTLYDMNEKITVSPYANAVSVYDDKVYYLADGCLYVDGRYLLGSGKDFHFPHSVDSNANTICIADENELSSYSFQNGKYEKTNSILSKASCIAIAPLPDQKIYYSIDDKIYCNNAILYSTEDPVVDIVIDGADNVYYTSDSSTYKNGEKIFDIGGKLALAPSKAELFNLFDGAIYQDGAQTIIDAQDAISFDVDGKNVYLLKQTEVEKYAYNGNFISRFQHSASEPSDIALSYEENSLGKLAIVSVSGHNVVFVDAETFTPFFEPKDNVCDKELIRHTTRPTPVFTNLNRSHVSDVLSASTYVVCSFYNLDCDDYLSYVSYKVGNSVRSGYVLKSNLSDLVFGATPRYENAKTLKEEVALNLLPFSSTQADNKILTTVNGAETEVKLISKYKIFDEFWYKAEYDGAEGYVLATEIQLGEYVPSILPKTNAKLVKESAIYDKIDGKYVEDTVFLSDNITVEVVGVFDSNREFTQIRYYDEEAGGTRTCYVKTSALKYDHVTFEQQFALIAVILLSVSMVIVIVIFVKRKRKSYL